MNMRFCYHCMNQIEEKDFRNCPHCGKRLTNQPLSAKYLKPGTTLQNKFVVGHPLGAGGFGNTYIGWNNLLLRKVAIKEFYPEQYVTRAKDGTTVTVVSDDLNKRFSEGLNRFLKEARSVASLQNIKGVVEISNYFQENGTGYIVMEYLEGMDVRTILNKSGEKKDYDWCRRVILTVLYTLREIHKYGVLHRDISPDNVFVTKEGVIKLIDFGTAKYSNDLVDLKSEAVLKAGYAPIEQYGRAAKEGAYTDLYAVAALFYRMLTGQKPIPANERLQDDGLIEPSQMGIKLPEQAEMAIMICLNIKPEYRLQSAEDFMEALDGKDFVPVYEPEWILPPVKEEKRLSTVPTASKIAIGVAVVCALVGGVTGIAVLHHQSNRKIKQNDVDSGGQVLVADYSGKHYDKVSKEIDELNLKKVSVIYELGSEKEGIITRQEPEPGKIDANTTLKLYVGGSKGRYTMEDFTGKKKEELIDYFEKYDFRIRSNDFPGADMQDVEYEAGANYDTPGGTICIVYQYSDEYEKDVCYEQSTDAGKTCRDKDDVTFTISCGKAGDYELPIPDLSGLGKKAAKKALKEAGLTECLNVEFSRLRIHDDSVKNNGVCEQSIPADYVYNTLEGKVYTYQDGVRTDEKSVDKLVVVMNAKNDEVEKTAAPDSAGDWLD